MDIAFKICTYYMARSISALLSIVAYTYYFIIIMLYICNCRPTALKYVYFFVRLRIPIIHYVYRVGVRVYINVQHQNIGKKVFFFSFEELFINPQFKLYVKTREWTNILFIVKQCYSFLFFLCLKINLVRVK